MKYKILGDRVKLFDSYAVSKKDFATELHVIQYMNPRCRLWHRSEKSLIREWASHNLAYSLNYKREKTADVDLNYEQKWYVKLAYLIVGNIALLIIK